MNRGLGSLLAAPLGLPGALFRNPVFLRQVAVNLGGTKFALVFIVVNAALIISTVSVIIAGIEGEELPFGTELGANLETINGFVIFGLLSLLLPLRVSGLFESARLDRAFDQVVVTGVPPGRLHLGNCAQAMAYAAVVLAGTLPYQAFAHACGGIGASTIALDCLILYLHAGVVVLVAMAFGVAMTEFVAAPVSIALFLFLGGLSFAPIPSGIAHWTPVRHFFQRGAETIFRREPELSFLYGRPAFFSIDVPDLAWMAVLWGIFALSAVVYLALGPVHHFTPGLNNFGNVVLPGDRKRSRLRTLRFYLTRLVEMSFLYENRPRRWDGLDWALRSAVILGFTLLLWASLVGLAFSPRWPGSPWRADGLAGYTLCMAAIGLGFALVAYGENRYTVHAATRVGPLRVSRGVLSLLFFAVALAGFAAYTYVPLVSELENRLAAGAPEMAREIEALPERVGILALFALTIYLLGRLIARAAGTSRAQRALLFLSILACLFLPMMLIVPLRQEGIIISRAVARLAYFSPYVALFESFDPRDSIIQRTLGRGDGAYWFLQGGFAVLLALCLLVLNCRRRLRRARGAPLRAASALALALALAASGASVGAEIDAEVVRGFGGNAFSNHEHFTIVLSRGEPRAGRTAPAEAEVQLLAPDGAPYLPPVRVELPPGTRRVVPIPAPPETPNHGPHHNLKLVVRAGGSTAEFPVPPGELLNDESLRFLFVNDEGKTPPLTPAGRRFVGSRPHALPERPEAYVGCDFALVDAAGLALWSSAQRRALYDFVRLGGTAVFFGAIDERAVGALGEWGEVLAPAEPPRMEGGELPYRIHPLRGGRAVWTVSEGGGEIPILSLRSLGPGRVGHLSVDPLSGATARRFGGEEEFWRRFAALAPTSLCGGLPLADAAWWMPRGGGGSLLAVALYFVGYAVLLGPVMLFLFRARRRRIWAWAYAPATSFAFVLGAPLLFLAMQSNPSRAGERRFVFLGGAGDEASGTVLHTVTTIYSSGRQRHRLSIRGEDATAFASRPGASAQRRYGWPYMHYDPLQFSPLGTATGPGPLEVQELSVLPWGSRALHALARVSGAGAPAVTGRVAFDPKNAAWKCAVEGLVPGTRATLIIFSSDTVLTSDQRASRRGGFAPFRDGQETLIEDISSWIHGTGSARGTVSATPGQGWRAEFFMRPNRLARPRAFVVFTASGGEPTVESDDLVFTVEEISNRATYYFRELEVAVPAGAPDGAPDGAEGGTRKKKER